MPLQFPTRGLLAAATIACASTAQSQVLSEWLGPTDGDWDDPANWTTPAFPNNGGGTTYDVLIAASGGSLYTVNYDGTPTVTIDSLVMDDSNARFQLSGMFTAGLIDIRAGMFRPGQADLHDTTLLSTTQALLAINQEDFRLHDVTIGSDIRFTGTDGFVRAHNMLQIADATNLEMQTTLQLTDGSSVASLGQSELHLLNGGGEISGPTQSGMRATIGPGVTLVSLAENAQVTGHITLQGTSRSTQSDQALSFSRANADDAVAIINEGVIESIDTGFVQLNSGVVNRGTLRTMDNGTIFLGGGVLLDTGTQLLGSGGQYVLSGVVLMGAHTFDLSLGYGVQIGGTVANGSIIGGTGDAATATGGDLQSMTLGVDVHANNDRISIHGGLTLTDGAVISSEPGSGLDDLYLQFNDAQTISGSGRIRFGVGNQNRIDFNGTGQVIFESGIFIDALTGSGTFGSDGATADWISRGTIAVGANEFLTLRGDWSNEGTLIVENGATLNMGGTFTTADIGSLINQGGDINITGLLDNTGDVLDLLFVQGPYILARDGIIRGGSIQSSGTSTLRIATGSNFSTAPALQDVTLNLSPEILHSGRMKVIDTLTLLEDLAIPKGVAIWFEDFDGDGVARLEGNATVSFIEDPNSGLSSSIFSPNGTALEIGQDITILVNVEMALTIGEADTVNFGTIRAEAGTLTLDGTWSNQGLVLIEPGGTLHLDGDYTTADVHSITNNGGSVKFVGNLNNTGDTLRLDATTLVGFDGREVQITGGRIETADGRELRGVEEIDGVVIAGDVYVDERVENGLTLDGGTFHTIGSVNLGSGGITGHGAIQFDGGDLRYTQPTNLPTGVVVDAGSTGGIIGGFSLDWTNDGVIQSLANGLEIRVFGGLENNNLVNAKDGGIVSFHSANGLTNRGILRAEDGGVLDVEDNWSNPTGTIELNNGGVFLAQAWSAVPGTFALNNGVIRVNFDADLTLLNTLPHAPGSAIELPRDLDLGGGTLDLDVVTSDVRLRGGTLFDGSVAGTSPLHIVNNSPSNDSTLDNVDIFADVVVSNTGTTLLRNGSSFHSNTIIGDGTFDIASGHTASFDGVVFESRARIDAGATLNITNGLTLEGTLTSGTGSGARPNVQFNGAQAITGAGMFESISNQGLNLRFTGDLTIGQDIRLVATQGVFSMNGAGQILMLDGQLQVATGRIANINTANFINNGTLQANLGGQININADTITNTGTVDLRGGTLRANDKDIHNTAGSRIISPGTVDLGFDGTLHIAGNVQNDVAPNTRLLVLGHLELADTAQTAMTLVDNRSDTLAFVHAIGDITLDGTLVLDSESLTQAEAGQTQSLVIGDTITGTFASINGTQIGPDLYWHLDYQADQLIAEVRLAGDATGDGLVGVEDLDLILANWGNAVTAADANTGEWTGDGLINNADLQVVLNHWGLSTPPPETNIPEPGSLAMLAMLLLVQRRRRS